VNEIESRFTKVKSSPKKITELTTRLGTKENVQPDRILQQHSFESKDYKKICATNNTNCKKNETKAKPNEINNENFNSKSDSIAFISSNALVSRDQNTPQTNQDNYHEKNKNQNNNKNKIITKIGKFSTIEGHSLSVNSQTDNTFSNANTKNDLFQNPLKSKSFEKFFKTKDSISNSISKNMKHKNSPSTFIKRSNSSIPSLFVISKMHDQKKRDFIKSLIRNKSPFEYNSMNDNSFELPINRDQDDKNCKKYK